MTAFDELKKAGDYLEYASDLEQRRSVWEREWEEITPYVNPRRSFFQNDYSTDEEGKPVAEDVYDSTAIDDSTTMRDGLVGYNVGPRIRWCALGLSQPELIDLPYVKDWLEDCEKILYMIWSNSNFYSAAAEMIMDAVSIGTATMLVEDPIRPMTLVYDCRHPKETYIDDYRGEVNLWMRKVWMKGRDLISRYGVEALGGEDGRLYKSALKAPFKRDFLIRQFIHPRDEAFVDSYNPLNRPWVSIEIAQDTKQIIWEDGFYESPAMTWRWEKNADETYGRSPALKAKSEILRLNEIGRTMLEKVQLDVEPPLSVPEELEGRERMIPFGSNYYRRDNREIKAIQLGGSYPIAIDWVDRLEQRIHNHFHADLFKMLTQATRQMTAREINERMGEKVALLSAPLTGQNNEMLAPAVKRTFHLAMRNGWLPLPPPALAKMNVQIDVEFVGPLAQAQQRYHQSHNVNAGIGTIAALAQSSGHMEIWDNGDLDELSRFIMENEGWPQKAIKEVVDRDRLRQKRAEEMEKQKKLENAERVAGMVPDISQAPEPGSLAETISKSGVGQGMLQ